MFRNWHLQDIAHAAKYTQMAERVCKLKLLLHRFFPQNFPLIRKFIWLYLAKKSFFRPEILQARSFYCVRQSDGKSLNSEQFTLASSTTLSRNMLDVFFFLQPDLKIYFRFGCTNFKGEMLLLHVT